MKVKFEFTVASFVFLYWGQIYILTLLRHSEAFTIIVTTRAKAICSFRILSRNPKRERCIEIDVCWRWCSGFCRPYSRLSSLLRPRTDTSRYYVTCLPATYKLYLTLSPQLVHSLSPNIHICIYYHTTDKLTISTQIRWEVFLTN